MHTHTDQARVHWRCASTYLIHRCATSRTGKLPTKKPGGNIDSFTSRNSASVHPASCARIAPGACPHTELHCCRRPSSSPVPRAAGHGGAGEVSRSGGSTTVPLHTHTADAGDRNGQPASLARKGGRRVQQTVHPKPAEQDAPTGAVDDSDVSTASESETGKAKEARRERAAKRKLKASEDVVDLRGPPATRPSARTLASSSSSAAASMPYAHGAVRITRTPGRQQAKNCINLGDVIQKDQLVSACIFSFFIANDELFQHLPFSQASKATDPPLFIGRDPNMDPMLDRACQEHGLHIKGRVTKKQLEQMAPTLEGMHRTTYGQNYHAFYAFSSGSSHSKVLVLVYSDFLRLVITSCNMMDSDTELGDNHWYIHDLPKRRRRSTSEPRGFEADFLAHLHALKTPAEFLGSIRGAYDYSTVKVHLVTSVPGAHSAARAEQYGLLRLRRVVRDLDLGLAKKAAGEGLQLEVCAASVGHLSAKWLTCFYNCALGSRRLGIPDEEHRVPPVKLFYPTVKDVKDAEPEAQNAASNIGCHTRPWEKVPADVKSIFHHYKSKDPGRLFHQKLIMACKAPDGTSPPWYVYLGSANFSAAAWGSLELDKKGNEATDGTKLIKMTNFECGVVVPGHLLNSLLETGTRDWNEGIVPHERSAARYARKEKPWNDVRWVTGYSDDWR